MAYLFLLLITEERIYKIYITGLWCVSVLVAWASSQGWLSSLSASARLTRPPSVSSIGSFLKERTINPDGRIAITNDVCGLTRAIWRGFGRNLNIHTLLKSMPRHFVKNWRCHAKKSKINVRNICAFSLATYSFSGLSSRCVSPSSLLECSEFSVWAPFAPFTRELMMAFKAPRRRVK